MQRSAVALVALALCLALSFTDTLAVIEVSGRYRIELCSRSWPGCSGSTKYIGFNNKTCTAGTPPESDAYGNTVGPLLRGADVSAKWRTWTVDVVSKEDDRSTVTIKNDFSAARCTKRYIDDYSERKDACKGTEWSDRVHMHSHPRKWTVKLAKGTDGKCYNIIHEERSAGCQRYLSANSNCKERHLVLSKRDDGSGLQQWRFVKVNGGTGSDGIVGNVCKSTSPQNCAKCCESKFKANDGSFFGDESCLKGAVYPQCEFELRPPPLSPPPTPTVLDNAPAINNVSFSGLYPEVSLSLSGVVPPNVTAHVDATCASPSGFNTSATAPVTGPETTVQISGGLPYNTTCNITTYTQSGPEKSPATNVTQTTPPAPAPSLTNFKPNFSDGSGNVTVVPPEDFICPGGGAIANYTVSWAGSGAGSTTVTSPGVVVLPPNSIKYGANGYQLNMTVIGECPDGTKTSEGRLTVDVPQCPSIDKCATPSTDGKCKCAECTVGYTPASTGDACKLLTCPNGQYLYGGICLTCGVPLNCETASPCTSISNTACTKCSLTYKLASGGCVRDTCASAIAGSNANPGDLSLFGNFVPFQDAQGGTTFQAGNYEIQYAGGCMKYGPGQGWTVNADTASSPVYTWYVGTARNAPIQTGGVDVVPPGSEGYLLACTSPNTPGNGCGFASYSDCVAYSKTLPTVTFNLPSAGPLGVYLFDGSPPAYNDNIPGTSVPGGMNPSWTIRATTCQS